MSTKDNLIIEITYILNDMDFESVAAVYSTLNKIKHNIHKKGGYRSHGTEKSRNNRADPKHKRFKSIGSYFQPDN